MLDIGDMPNRARLQQLLSEIAVSEPEYALICHVVLGLTALRNQRARLEDRVIEARRAAGTL
ncbi:MAG: hypothetical protein WKF75_05955 [Singulisphaera sp.]